MPGPVRGANTAAGTAQGGFQQLRVLQEFIVQRRAVERRRELSMQRQQALRKAQAARELRRGATQKVGRKIDLLV